MKKKGFSLLFSLLFLMLTVIIIASIININKKGIVQTQNTYLDIVSDNLLKNLTEYSILAIQGHDFSKGCLQQINYDAPLFKGTATFHYFLTNCNTCLNCSKILTKETNGSVLIEVVIKSKNPNLFIRKERETLQNP